MQRPKGPYRISAEDCGSAFEGHIERNWCVCVPERSNAHDQHRTEKNYQPFGESYVWNKAFACIRVEKHRTASAVMSIDSVRQTVSVSVSNLVKLC